MTHVLVFSSETGALSIMPVEEMFAANIAVMQGSREEWFSPIALGSAESVAAAAADEALQRAKA